MSAPYRRRATATGVALVVAAALAGGGATAAGIGPLAGRAAADPGNGSGNGNGNGDGNGNGGTVSTALATIARGTLASLDSETASLGYAGTYSVVNQAQGVLTAVPDVGQVITAGHVLYRVDGKPVVLLYGGTPIWRALSVGLSGTDVRQLNAALVSLGYAAKADLDPTSDTFSWATATALEKLQKTVGLDQTGTLALGQVVFVPTAARITAVSGTLGGQAGPGTPVLTASSTRRLVTITLDATKQAAFRRGAAATITLPDGSATPGRVTSVGTVATTPAADSSGKTGTPTIPVTVTPTRPADTGSLDQATVTVAVVSQSVRNVLSVPVNALLALAGGGYAVEVDTAGVRRLVGVTLGLFDDGAGRVEVTGTGLSAGQRVVVPAS